MGVIVDFRTRREVKAEELIKRKSSRKKKTTGATSSAATGGCVDCSLRAATKKFYWLTMNATAAYNLEETLESLPDGAEVEDRPSQSVLTWKKGCDKCPHRNAMAIIAYTTMNAIVEAASRARYSV